MTTFFYLLCYLGGDLVSWLGLVSSELGEVVVEVEVGVSGSLLDALSSMTDCNVNTPAS